jgi:nitrite reductase/ring-hydroxylating ferredoxin subunit
VGQKLMALFGRKRRQDEDGFYITDIAAGDVVPGSLHTVKVGSDRAIVTRLAGKLIVFSAVCPHAAADLSRGRLFDGQIKCPEHGYTFDLRHGRATWPPDEGCHLTRFTALEDDDGRVRIKLARPAR